MKKALAVLAVSLVLAGTSLAGVSTFDDITTEDVAQVIPVGYGGLTWANFGVVNCLDYVNNPSGYLNGVVSGEYVAFNHNGNPAAISSGDAFSLVGAYFTASWQDGLLIEVQGYLAGDLVYSTEFEVDTDGPSWIAFNWLNVDEVTFTSSGGVPAFANRPNGGTQFAMDNLTTRDALPGVPAPGAVLLVSLGAGLTGWLRRRRAL